jgi:membrane protease YdiL (CAAX protease family)
MHLPSWLSGIEDWMMDKEKMADNLIDSLINSGSFWVMILNLFTIAFIPAIAEELIFRGVLQRIFGRLFKSLQAGIWFTAILFSAVHLQFYGFLPRFILGLTFGYLFFWGGILWLPIIAHFINNAFPVIYTYIEGANALNEPTGIALWKQAIFLPVPLTVIFLILYYFHGNYEKKIAETRENRFPQSPE